MPIPRLFPRSALSRPVWSRLAVAAICLAATATGAGVAQAALPGLSCKSVSHKGTGFHHSRNGAQKMAMIDWIQQATAAYGQPWASWGRAAQRSVSCTHNPSQSQHGWYCSARGRPCRYRQPGVTPHRFRTPHPARPNIPPRRREFRRQFRRQ